MKKLLKIIKALVITILVFVALVYGTVFIGHHVLFRLPAPSTTPTLAVVQNEEFTFGVQAHSQPQTMDEYVNLLAQQVANYSLVAPTLWPGNALIDRSVIVESIDRSKFWHITPEGSVTVITKKQALDDYGVIRNIYSGGFSEFDGGIYLAVSDYDRRNVLSYQQYLHLGTYDPFITFAHEDFHGLEQPKWARLDESINTSRGEFLEDVAARAKRNLLQRQLLQAIANPDDQSLILAALATYDDYQTQFPLDFQNSIFADRIEGTAFYYELIASLYAAYPDQIKTPDDVQRALTLLATRPDVYVDLGLTAEGYSVGGFACVLLDRLESNWQERLMANSKLTPIAMLREHFAAETLPAPQPQTPAEIDAVGEQINAEADSNIGLAQLFNFFYQLLF